MIKVAKFGGSSLADAAQFEKVKSIIEADDSRRVIVVSAPGKKNSKDNKVTDLLYLSYAHIKYHVDYHEILSVVEARYCEIAKNLYLDFDVKAEFDKIREKIAQGESEAYLVSRGEALCAKLMACYLGWKSVDDCIFLNFDGSIDYNRSYEALKVAFTKNRERMVVPGFFGIYPDGTTGLMDRGGSDITGAICAAALDAEVYENWTDVPGILMADPAIVRNPISIPGITYEELHELTYMGAKVLHEASVYPVKKAGIPINIRDTNHPEFQGTVIKDSFEDEDDENFYITGVAGRNHFTIIDVKQDNLDSETLSKTLNVLKEKGIRPEQINFGTDVFSIVINGSTSKQILLSAMAEIKHLAEEASLSVTEGISLIACVSRRMVFKPGISGLIFKTLGDNDINIRMISQGARELSILIGVDDSDYERTVKVLVNSFTQKN